MANIGIKRVYDPESSSDGRRFLVERLWPRGVRKEDLHMESWQRDASPSTELRKWYGHDVERWPGFQQRYRKELDANEDGWRPLRDAARQGRITLLYGARDEQHNSAVVLRDYLAKKIRSRGTR